MCANWYRAKAKMYVAKRAYYAFVRYQVETIFYKKIWVLWISSSRNASMSRTSSTLKDVGNACNSLVEGFKVFLSSGPSSFFFLQDLHPLSHNWICTSSMPSQAAVTPARCWHSIGNILTVGFQIFFIGKTPLENSPILLSLNWFLSKYL